MPGGQTRGAYYNDSDAYCAAWLRNLIAGGLIPQGDVDERSVTDVQAEEIRDYDQWHLFAGIAGWPSALRLAEWSDERPVLTASVPCQPFSAAGRRRGHDDDRNLWPHALRLIRELRPRTCLGEQVAAAIGYGWLDGICDDLEREGYAVAAADLPACSVGAPHIRQRLFWVAERDGNAGRLGHAEREGNANARRRHIGEAPGQVETADGQREWLRIDAGQPDDAAHRWRDAVWLPCLDGKARRVPQSQPDFRCMAHGIWLTVDQVVSRATEEAIQEVRGHAKTADVDPSQALSMVRAIYAQETLSFTEQDRRSWGISTTDILFAFLCRVESALGRTTHSGSGAQESPSDACGFLRGLRCGSEHFGSSPGRESEEQPTRKSSDALWILSRLLARRAEAIAAAIASSNALFVPLTVGEANRTAKLKALGNAVIPPLAAEFIRAVMDLRP